MPPCNAACNFPQFPCPADIVPERFGDFDVDVDDLIAVILGWGPCGNPSPEDMPQSIQDCMDKATDEFGTDSSPAKTEFIEKCILGLCEAGLINCD
jgi:hypothetical protein